MVDIVEMRKCCAATFLDEPSLSPPHHAKRDRFKPCVGSMAPATQTLLAFERIVFLDDDQQGLKVCFAALRGCVGHQPRARRTRRNLRIRQRITMALDVPMPSLLDAASISPVLHPSLVDAMPNPCGPTPSLSHAPSRH